ncbi:MAG TPA: AAA family ATPase [Acidimicrobiales bacterium]
MQLASGIRELVRRTASPVFVAIDGRSGAGKSTLARSLARTLGAAVIEGDDFYAGGSAEQWDMMSAAARADHCIDWRRQRPVLDALRGGEPATWTAYDWDADDGRPVVDPRACAPHRVVILEGVYSARPELADLLHLRVLLDTPAEIRAARLLEREGEHRRGDWPARWSSAEDHYFAALMPPEVFDVVIGA